MRKLIIIIATTVALAQPVVDISTIETKRARLWMLNVLQIQTALEIQQLRETIKADVKTIGCTIDEALETRPVCAKPEAKK